MTNEEKKAATIKRAEENKANFDLHQQLIKQHIEFDIGDLKKASVEYFLENGTPTGGFLLALMAYAEEYHKTKVKNISSNSMLADELPLPSFTEYWTPIIDKLKGNFSGSNDYMSGVNDGMYEIIKHIAAPIEEGL